MFSVIIIFVVALIQMDELGGNSVRGYVFQRPSRRFGDDDKWQSLNGYDDAEDDDANGDIQNDFSGNADNNDEHGYSDAFADHHGYSDKYGHLGNWEEDEYFHYSSPVFHNFMRDYNKTYSTNAEYLYRLQVFNENVESIREHNHGGHSWTQGINKFTDMTDVEYNATLVGGSLGGFKQSAASDSDDLRQPRQDTQSVLKNLPGHVDWREQGIITPVKDQGWCGSCWAFAATESIESYAAINNGTLLELSSQQMTSCTPFPMQCGGGCNGSWPGLGFAYTRLFGLSTEKDYPYISGQTRNTENCVSHLASSAVETKGYVSMSNDQEAVMHHLATKGPLGVVMDALTWKAYSGGVFDGCSFSENILLNHALQLVGYGTDNKTGARTGTFG